MLAGIRDIWVRAALAVSLAVPVYFLAAALGVKFGMWDWLFGFGRMTVTWGPYLLYGAAGLAAIGFVLALVVAPRRGRGLALVALAIPAGLIGYGAYLREQGRAIAPIHDITTDFVDPPAFSEAVVAARAETPGANSLDLLNETIPQQERFGSIAGMPVIEVQREAYPQIDSIPSGLPPAEAFDLALDVARAQPWTLGLVDREAGVIEAAAESLWFGFIDDVAIRVRADGAGSRIDARSASRVGLSDFGANAKRLDKYLAALRARVEATES